MKRNRFLVFLFIVFSFVSKAQNYQFTNYSLLEGLPQSQVYCIHEDEGGYIWMGTRGGGITRFDGLEFQTFTVKDGLAGNYINAISSFGYEIWVGTNSGLSYFHRNKWVSPSFFKGKIIQDVKFQENKLWVVAGGSVYKSANVNFSAFELVKGLPKRIKSLKVDQQSIWLADNFSIYQFKDSLAMFSLGKPIESFEFGRDSAIWVATHGEGLYKYENNAWYEHGYLMGIDKEIVYNLYSEGDHLWISTLTKGVFRFNTQDSSFVNFKEENGLANNHCRTSFKDSWGSTWIGTGGGGVSKYSGQTFEKWSKSNGLKGNYIYSVIEGYKGTKYIGTSGGGVTLVDTNTRYFNKSNGFSNFKTKALFQSKDSTIWLGTDGDGLTLLLKDTILKFSTKNGLRSDWIKAFAEDEKGNVWVGTYGGGISKFFRESDTLDYSVKTYSTVGRQLISDHIIDIELDAKGRVWYAVPGKGLGYIDGENFSRSTISGLNRENLRSICADSNYLYVASTKGINVVNLWDALLQAQTLENPFELTSENIYSLQLDAQGNLWVGSEKGLDKLVLDGTRVLELDHFDADNGFTGVETTTNASMLDGTGNVWFGSINGLYKYINNADVKNLIAPKLNWTEIKINGTNTSEILDKYPRLDEWQLPYGRNRLSFDFVGINQSSPRKVKYRWKLSGWDDEFNEPTYNHFVEYGGLSPGTYNFIVEAMNEDGIWTERGLFFSFTVVTPIWQEPYFIILAVFLFAVLLFLLYVWRISITKRKSKEREEKLELEKNLVQLEQKALQLQMNPHFIFHTLNSIQELIATKEEKIARKYLTQFSKLMRQILDGSRDNTTSLASEIKMLTNYLSLEKFSHEDRFDFEISCESDELEFISIPSMIIQPFVENALIHGALKAEKEGRVSIEFQVFEKEVKCIILDNGPGLGVNTSDHKSSAIEITKERLTMLSGKEKSVEIKNRELNGVEAIVLLPIIEENETV